MFFVLLGLFDLAEVFLHTTCLPQKNLGKSKERGLDQKALGQSKEKGAGSKQHLRVVVNPLCSRLVKRGNQ